MNTKSTMTGGMMWLVLAVSASGWTGTQPPSPPPSTSTTVADSLWYGEWPTEPPEPKYNGIPTYCPCPRVYAYTEGLILERSNDAFDQPLIVETIDGNQGATFLATSDLQFDYEPALRIHLGVRLHDGWALEGAYFGLYDGNAAAFLTPPDDDTNLTFPGGLVTNVISGVDRIYVNYTASLEGVEANLVHCRGLCDSQGKPESGLAQPWGANGAGIHCRSFDWLAGFRYVSLEEGLNIYGERDQQTAGGTIAIEHGPYDIRTLNHLYGGQVGARVRSWGAQWGWEASGKVGVFGNDASQQQYIIDFPDFELRPPTGAAGVDVAFLGELNLTAIYRLSEMWSVRGGYNLLWISGLALAPDQLDFRGTLPAGDQLHSTGSLFLHGTSVGLEARW